MLKLDFHITGGNFTSAGEASSKIKRTLKQLGVDPAVIKRTVVSVYEAEVNIVAHAYEGNIFVNIDSECINIVVEDQGPGIEDINQAIQAGYSTASQKVREMGFGAGMGLPNIKANSDKFEISSVLGQGTKLQITNTLKSNGNN
ncbi:MAG: anti-sigma regulatory factor [Bacteroidales bacterium]|nr:anti-sigma regulatory factor [Bacteroidales bacterium]